MRGFTSYMLILLVFGHGPAIAQYTVNGSATRDNCHCYTLTPNLTFNSGSVWNNNRIDLNQPFTFTFDINLGCNDANGADGIAFVLQPISTSVGGSGSGMGYGGITPAVGITLDTYQNSSPDSDPFYDHIAIQLNGDVNHLSPNTLTPLTSISASGDNAEDCAWHILKISWEPSTFTLTAWFDGVQRVTASRDFVTSVFGGNSQVFWGFTGATGSLVNLQQFCTALNPNFRLLPTQKRCIAEPITFYDSTISFAPLQKRYWDFGDGSPIDSVNVNPVHTYLVAGDYTVTLTVIGADGCIESNSQVVRIGSKPLANFNGNNGCVNSVLAFTNTSVTQVGTINSWYWDFGNGNTVSTQHPTQVYTSPGSKTLRLAVKSLEGCTSDTTDKIIQVYPQPLADFNYSNNLCNGNSIQFTNLSSVSPGSVTSWSWDFGDGNTTNAQHPVHAFVNPGIYNVSLIVVSNFSCTSVVRTKPIVIQSKPVAFFKLNPICETDPISFIDSSYSGISTWWWDLGNGTITSIQNPVTVYNTPGTDTVKLVVSGTNGCRSDTLFKLITINAKPLAEFGYNAAVCYGSPVNFFDSSSVTGGTINTWSWTYSGSRWETIQNPTRLFFPGTQTVGLVATSMAGCKSDTTYHSFFIYPRVEFDMNFNDECKNTPVDFTATDRTGGKITKWEWKFEPGAFSNSRDTQYTFLANGSYPVQLVATDSIGCTSTLTRNIIIYGTNAFAGNDTIAAAGQPFRLNASGGIDYTWSPSTGLSNPSIANPLATIFTTQTYTLKAFTPEGCESYDDVVIKIYNGPEIYLPNAFSPNGDQLNDIFRGIPVGIKDFRYLKVFNRWGQEIFSSTDYRKGWDGKWKGQDQPVGVYIVISYGIDFNGKEIIKKGTVMLMR